jgi:hypothetical protein
MKTFEYYNIYAYKAKLMYYTNKTSPTLAIIAIAMAIALVIAGSITASALAAKGTHKKGASSFTKTSATTLRSTGGGSSLSKLINCIRGTSGLTKAAVDDCYDTTYAHSSSSNGAYAYGGLVPLGSQ